MKHSIVKSIHYNWFASQENGEEYQSYDVGKNCKQIYVHYPQHAGDKFWATVTTNHNEMITIFNINKIIEIEQEHVTDEDR